MSLIAYELRAEFEESYASGGFGGSTAVLDGRLVDVNAELAKGAGRIIVDDADLELVTAFDAYPALKRAAVGDAAGPTLRRYDFMGGDELRADAQRRAIGKHSAGKVDDVRAALEQQDAHLAAGDLPAANAVTVGELGPQNLADLGEVDVDLADRPALVAEAKRIGVDATGTKAELADRITAHRNSQEA